MPSINITNTSAASGAYSSKGISGLQSGIDTEQLVKDMMSGTQGKIDKAKQEKQLLEWKQELYRNVIKSLTAFQSKFFSFSNEKTNLLSKSFFSAMTAKSSSAGITAVASSTALQAQIKVDYVSQLATQTKILASGRATGALEGEFNPDALAGPMEDRKLVISVGENEAEIVIRGNTQSAIVNNLNAELEAAFGEGVITATFVDGTLVLETADEGQTIKIHEESSDIAAAILGLKKGTTATGEVSGTLDVSQASNLLTVTLDGISKTIELNTEAADAAEFVTSLQSALNKAFGNSVRVTENDGVLQFTTMKTTYDENGDPVVTEDHSRQITFTGSNAVMEVLGMQRGQSNKISAAMKLGDINFSRALSGLEDPETGADVYHFAINGTEFTFTSEDTLSSLISRVNASDAGVTVTYSSLEDKFILTSKDYGAGFDITMEDMDGSNLLYSLFGDDYTVAGGQNSILSVNGIEIQRSGNSFTIDGVTLTLKEITDTPILIEVERNTEQIMQGIVEFVDEYNKLIDELNDLIRAKPTYKNYPPLTDAQKNEMSQQEIVLWEEKAKEGLLRNDSTIYDLLNDMRRALYNRVSDSAYALYDLGIETSGIYSDYGKLVITDKSKLQKAIESDPESIRALFNDEEKGIATSINNLINSSTRVSYASSGSLVKLAGTAAYTGKSSLDRQIELIEERLKRLQTQYNTEKTRYWNQFNRMEELIAIMYQQSSWLSSMFSY